jgi:SAM-dependent methyltransferase
MKCPICKKNSYRVTKYTFFCSSCDHWTSSLKNNEEVIKIASPYSLFSDEKNNENEIYFLNKIRLITSKIIISDLKKLGIGNLLDVGCASGLFLNVAVDYGFNVKGVEPNKERASYAKKRGIPVDIGFFPEALKKGCNFKFITFNDVLEHICDIETVIQNSYNFLEPKGYLSINVPNSHGLFFKLSRTLVNVGYTSPWDRLWQKMFYTPHIHYFSPKSLTKIVENYNFTKVLGPKPLPVISLDNLWGRISATPNISLLNRIAQYVAFFLIYPIYKFSTKDSFFIVFQKK